MTFTRKRGRVYNDFRHRIVESADGCYRVVESRFLLSNALPRVYYAMVNVAGQWQLIGRRHRKQSAAQRACEAHARKLNRTTRPVS